MKKIQIKYSELSQSEIVIKRIILSFGIKIEICTSAIIRNRSRIWLWPKRERAQNLPHFFLIIKKTFLLKVIHSETQTFIYRGIRYNLSYKLYHITTLCLRHVLLVSFRELCEKPRTLSNFA